jgi:hypothetical protein
LRLKRILLRRKTQINPNMESVNLFVQQSFSIVEQSTHTKIRVVRACRLLVRARQFLLVFVFNEDIKKKETLDSLTTLL